MQISDWRMEIDKLDDGLLRLLNERAMLAARIGKFKHETNLPLSDIDRERAVLERLCQLNSGPLDEAAITAVFREIIAQTRRFEAGAFPHRHKYHDSSLVLGLGSGRRK